MSNQYIVQRDDGMFLTHGQGWSGEYPDAQIFLTLSAARRVVKQEVNFGGLDDLKIGIYETEDYAMGNGPVVQG
jgi:hypothetical protein